MTKKELQEYSIRVTQSSKTGLVVITYEIITNYLESAKKAYDVEDIKDFIHNINKAKQFVNELSSCLDFKYKISLELFEIYLYINRVLVDAVIKKDKDQIDSIIGIIGKLKEAFSKISEEEKIGSVMNNTEKIYAGLTYSKGKLNEYTVR